MADCEQAKPRIFAVQARQIETWRNRSGERNMKQNRGTGLEHWTEHLLEFHVNLMGAKLNIENLLHARVNGKLYPNKINARPFVESSLQDSQMFVSPYSSIVVFCISLSLSHTRFHCTRSIIVISFPFTFSILLHSRIFIFDLVYLAMGFITYTKTETDKTTTKDGNGSCQLCFVPHSLDSFTLQSGDLINSSIDYCEIIFFFSSYITFGSNSRLSR